MEAKQSSEIDMKEYREGMINFDILKDEIEYTVKTTLLKHPEHNTTDIVIEFPNGNKFNTTVVNREYEEDQRALIGRTIHTIVYKQLKIEKDKLAKYIYEKGLLLTQKGRPKYNYKGAEHEEHKEKERERFRKLYQKRKALKEVSPIKA